MDLYEYQARDLFEKYGVPVLAGIVADTPDEVRAAAERLGGVVVVKAQVKTGGRGKAGGVKVAKNPDEAYEAAESILGLDIKGHVVKRVMVAAGARIAKEYYFSVLLDRANRSYLSLASVEGGMEIEELTVERPEALARVEVDPIEGITPERALEIAQAARFDDELAPKVADVFVKLFQVYQGEDATLVEVNPLILSEDGDIIALDGKVSLDENAGFRHPEHEALEDADAADPLEAKAKEHDLTTSSSTVRSASSATVRVWSCRPLMSSRTPVRSTAASSPPTSSTSAVARRRPSWRPGWMSSSATSRSRACS